jgi:hypothetical protein
MCVRLCIRTSSFYCSVDDVKHRRFRGNAECYNPQRYLLLVLILIRDDHRIQLSRLLLTSVRSKVGFTGIKSKIGDDAKKQK